MLIGIVRESVLQCFCHTCRAPIASAAAVGEFHRRNNAPITKVKTKPIRTHQPKKVQFVTTEVRCQEKTKGGVCYEVILGDPQVKSSPLLKKRLSPKNSVSVQDIEDKLKAAEERRQQHESNKIAALSIKLQKIEEASRKKDEQTNQFIFTTRDALEQKMGNVTEKREAYITDLKTKLKDHIENVEKTRHALELQTGEVRSAIEEKLKSASIQRDENMRKMLDRLKEHEEQVMKVKALNNVKLQELGNQIQEKLDQARNRKEQIEQEQLEKLRKNNLRPHEKQKSVESVINTRKSEVINLIENKLCIAEQIREQQIQKKLEPAKKYNEHLNEVKQTLENKKSEQVQKLENKLSAAEQKREEEIKKKLENIKKHEKHAETVRQNKAVLAAKTESPEQQPNAADA
ncbi:uncharacterized protein PF3D7_1120000 isoform X1 [Euwallacea similis]|uniref:uncharacterized protein PF3D7_1120000 isoform X1 n=1 Tax=Euwallacea similis TaxID=1736056 RepID=UPI00344BB244